MFFILTNAVSFDTSSLFLTPLFCTFFEFFKKKGVFSFVIFNFSVSVFHFYEIWKNDENRVFYTGTRNRIGSIKIAKAKNVLKKVNWVRGIYMQRLARCFFWGPKSECFWPPHLFFMCFPPFLQKCTFFGWKSAKNAN